MRTIPFLPLLIAGVLFTSCENYKEENEQLKEQIQELNEQNIEQNALLESFGETMGLIQQNLMEIREKEGSIQVISSYGNEKLMDARQEVMDDFDAIQRKMAENKEAIERLNKLLSSSNSQNSKIKRMIEQLNGEIAVRDSSIAVLRQDLENRNLKIVKLEGQMDNLREQTARELKEKEDQMNQVFYTAGSYRELEQQGVVDKSGGFIGLGRVKTLQDDLDKSNFVQVDKRSFTRLSIGKRKVDILSTHPASSYELEMDGKTVVALVINNPEAFWKSSNTLVVLWD
jgi:DNA repair exonuclease SbcCD ATPase subunit